MKIVKRKGFRAQVQKITKIYLLHLCSKTYFVNIYQTNTIII